MAADSPRDADIPRPATKKAPNWLELSPDSFLPGGKLLALAQLPKDGDAQAKTEQKSETTAPVDYAARLKQIEADIAQNRPYDRVAFITALSHVASSEMNSGNLAQAKDHFKRANTEFKEFFKQADKDVEEKRKAGQPLDPAFERNYRVAEDNYLQMLRQYGKTLMTLHNSYSGANIPDYASDPAKLAAVIQDRRDADDVFVTALTLGQKRSLAPLAMADILRDKGLNGSLLADDMYRPKRETQNVTDLAQWRAIKDSSIATLKHADKVLDTVLGPKDKKAVIDLDKKQEPPEAALQMRARLLGELAKIETFRSNDPTDEFAKDAGKHFIEALTAWDEYAPLLPGNEVLRSKRVNRQLMDVYKDYSFFASIMAAKHPDLATKGFFAGQFTTTQTRMANIIEVDSKLER